MGVAGRAGRTCELQRKLNLADATWQPVATRGPLAADQILELTDPAATAPAAVYRVRTADP